MQSLDITSIPKCINIRSQLILVNEGRNCVSGHKNIKDNSLEFFWATLPRLNDPDYRESLRHRAPKQMKISVTSCCTAGPSGGELLHQHFQGFPALSYKSWGWFTTWSKPKTILQVELTWLTQVIRGGYPWQWKEFRPPNFLSTQHA